METVLLVNPPGDQPFIRDYFCSKVSKSGYLYHPTDLLILSGILSPHFKVAVLDAIVEGLSEQAALERIRRVAPDHVIALTGSVSFSRDCAFLARVRKKNPRIRSMAAIGDIFFENPRDKLKRLPFLDALLFDFTDACIVDFFRGERCENMVFRENGTGAIQGEWRKAGRSAYSHPVPRYDLFPNKRYTYPFCRKKPFGVVLTNFGCPFKCAFCIMSSLGFKSRDPENVLEELRYLKDNGFRNIYFNDQTFGADKKQTRALLRAMREQGLDLGFVCFTRVDLLDEEFAGLLKEAGCHTVMFGVESSDPGLLERYSKGITPEMVENAATLCRKNRIRTVGTFILGLPGETRETALATIAFAKRIPLDYASFNIAIPRMGTGLREMSLEQGYVDPDQEEMDQSGSTPLIETGQLGLDEVRALQKKAYREFYFRPGKMLAQLLDIRTRTDLFNHIRNGWGVFASLFK